MLRLFLSMKYNVTQVSWIAVGDAVKSAMELENVLCKYFNYLKIYFWQISNGLVGYEQQDPSRPG